MLDDKKEVHDFWNQASCGEVLHLKGCTAADYHAQSVRRYELEPMIQDFAAFDLYENKDVLEIGVGLGAEHQKFAEAGANLTGIDLTERAILHTARRLDILNLKSNLQVADAEHLPYSNESFDLVYSWGVLHHTPNTLQSIKEVHRVLKKGGEAKIMIYHKYSMVGYILWLRYALLKFKPLTPLSTIYAEYLESPGTKAFSKDEAVSLFKQFQHIDIQIKLSHGDLLASAAGQRHRGFLLTLAKRIWPRYLIKNFFSSHGLFMLIVAVK